MTPEIPKFVRILSDNPLDKTFEGADAPKTIPKREAPQMNREQRRAFARACLKGLRARA